MSKLPLFEREVDKIVTDNSRVIAALESENAKLQQRIAELEKVLLATPDTHSDEWSDYVCTFCSAGDFHHENDCVHLLAIKLRNQAKGE